MTPDQIAAHIDGAIRILFNSGVKEFCQIFGDEDGPYLWAKFVKDKNRNEGDFICYLDADNQRKLASAVMEYVKTQDPYYRMKAGT